MTRFHFERPDGLPSNNVQNISRHLDPFIPPQGFPSIGGGPPVLFTTYNVVGGSSLTAVKFNNLDSGATPGTKMFIVSAGDNLIRQYSLTNPFDMTQANVTLVAGTFDTAEATENIPTGMEWDPDGLELFVTGDQFGDVLQFGPAGTAYDLSTVSTTPRTTVLDTLNVVPTGLIFDVNGSKLFVSGATPDGVRQFTLPGSYTIQGVSNNDGFFTEPLIGANIRSITFPTANKMFLLDLGNKQVIQYSVSNAFDVTTGTVQITNTFDLQTFTTASFGMTFSNNGLRMFILDSGGKVFHFTLSSPFQL